jgi:hypothetical protein
MEDQGGTGGGEVKKLAAVFGDFLTVASGLFSIGLWLRGTSLKLEELNSAGWALACAFAWLNAGLK